MTMITGEKNIALARMLTLKQALRLETLGMKRRGPSVYSIVKKEFGLRGNKHSVFTQFCELTEKRKGEL